MRTGRRETRGDVWLRTIERCEREKKYKVEGKGWAVMKWTCRVRERKGQGER